MVRGVRLRESKCAPREGEDGGEDGENYHDGSCLCGVRSLGRGISVGGEAQREALK